MTTEKTPNDDNKHLEFLKEQIRIFEELYNLANEIYNYNLEQSKLITPENKSAIHTEELKMLKLEEII